MTKTKSTKRALLGSALALLICMSMLIGSTFAWFTDSVTSSGNKIQAGTLNIDMLVKDETGAYKSVKENKAPIFTDDVLWEPGYTEWRNIKVSTTGNLALKYQMNIAMVGETSALADVIDVYYAASEIAKPSTRSLDGLGLTRLGTLSEIFGNNATGALIQDTLIPSSNSEDFATIVLKMQESAGNQYQGLSIGAFDINIAATQLTYEKDSFDDQYDKDAPFSKWDGTVPAEKPDTLVVDPATRTITINDAAAFAYLGTHLANWVDTYSNGQGVEYSNYAIANGGKGTDYYYMWGWDVKLNADIDLGFNAWTPVSLAAFRGVDGQGHTVKNIKVTATQGEAGLFSIIPGGVSNLTLENVNINAASYNVAGAVAGSIHGKINNVNVKNAFVTGNKYVGGIVGYGYAYIINSTVSDSVITVPNNGEKEAGGLAGYLCLSTSEKTSISNNVVKNTVVSAPTVASAIVSQPNANYEIKFNTVENTTITTVDDTADVFVSNNVGNTSVISNNKQIDCTVNKAATIPVVAQDTAALKNAANTANATIMVAPGKYTTVALKDGVTLIGSEGTVIEQAAGTQAALGSTKNTTIKNVEFVGTNAQRWGYAGGDVVFENCTFRGEGTGSLSWAIHYDGLNGANITYTNCDIYGWVAIGGGASSLVFDNCNFYGNGEFGLCRAYSNFTVKNCTFDYSNVDPNGTRSVGIQALSGATVTIDNCTNVNGSIEDVINMDYVGTQYEGNVILNGVAYVAH